ncbi:lysophospholipid acyltransferase 7 [Parasteatoda tepidariorum]|nr:lysophospholipid acyltransferase 7 [Parasteatoda tepidariorum]XP_042900627.1 lysophospholipid acyltransferase 7 [Parasteatoda tepidariorum]
MILDDIIYISLLCISVILGPVIRNVPNPYQRQVLSTSAGFIIVFIVSGFHVVHSVLVTLINAIILQFFKKKCHIYSAIFSFGYLAFFRSTHYFGLPIPPPHTNAIQMILTLKMVGLAFEVQETRCAKEKNKSHNFDLLYKYKKVEPSFLDVFHYAFCIAGVLIGPYYKFRTYWDMLYLPYSTQVAANRYVKQRIQIVPLYVLLYLIGTYLYPLEYVTTPDILEKSFWYRVFYITPSFFNFRMRIYAGFILGECVCIAMGLGAYPKSSNPQPGAGPTNFTALEEIEKKNLSVVEYSFDTVNNIYEYGSEFWPTIREGIRSWNRTVQYWLAFFVYKRINLSKPAKIFVTMLVSSFWHGVHPGYYLCLCSAPLFLFVEMEVEKAVRRHGSHSQQALFYWIWWVIKMQSFSYMGMAFLLLDIRSCFYFWKSIYFCGHIFIILVYFIALTINTRMKRKKE